MIIKSLLNILADSNSALRSVMTHHADDLVNAIKQGNVDDFLRGTANGAEILADPTFIRIMGRLGDNLQHIDELEAAVRAGRNISDDLVRILDDDALARQLSRNLDDAVRGTLGATDDMIRTTDEALSGAQNAARRTMLNRFNSYMNSAPTRLQMLAMAIAPHAAVYAYAQMDSEGRIPLWLMEQAAEGIADGFDEATQYMTDDEKLAYLTEQINDVEEVKNFIFPPLVDNLTQNAVVRLAANMHPDDPEAQINAAILWQLKNPALLTAKLTIRSMALTRIYPEPETSAEERNAMLARGFVDDIIEGAQCAELRDAGLEVTEQHVLDQIRLHADTLNSTAGISGLRRGLVEAYPELEGTLDTTPDPEPVLTAEAPNGTVPGQDNPPSAFDPSALSALASGDWRTQGSDQISQTYNQLVSATGVHEEVGFWSCLSLLLGMSDTDDMSMTDRFNAYADLAKFMADNPVISMIAGFIGRLFGADIPGVDDVKRLAVAAAANSDSVMASMRSQFEGATDLDGASASAAADNDDGTEHVAELDDRHTMQPGAFAIA